MTRAKWAQGLGVGWLNSNRAAYGDMILSKQHQRSVVSRVTFHATPLLQGPVKSAAARLIDKASGYRKQRRNAAQTRGEAEVAKAEVVLKTVR